MTNERGFDDFDETESTPKELKVLGKVVGTCSGWDGDVDSFIFYDFNPNKLGEEWLPEIVGKEGIDIVVSYHKGTVSYCPIDQAALEVATVIDWSVFNINSEAKKE